MSGQNDQWWVTQGGREPVGPASTELVLRGIAAGRVPLDSYVCEVGGAAWKPVREVREFAKAVAVASALRLDERPAPAVSLRRFDSSDDRTLVDVEPVSMSEGPRPTDRSPAPQSRASGFPALSRFDASDESRTVADGGPPIPSEPRTERRTSPKKRRLEIVEELTLTDSEPFFPPE